MKLPPFLPFDGNCAEAMAFYGSCFGSPPAITKVGDTPMKQQYPPGEHQKVIYAHLKSDAIEFSATDWLHRTRGPRQGNTVAMYVTDGSYPELRALFDKLSAGGDPALLDDLRKLPFGFYGHLADKYGVHWFFKGEAGSD